MAGQRRRGYTLIEVTLVLAILVISTALAVPYMENMLSGNQLTAAADLVKSRLNDMRSRAREEGRRYKLTLGENGGTFKIEPLDESATLPNFVSEEQLPKDISFRFPDCKSINTGDGTREEAATTEMVVLPDGTAASDYEISFGGTDGGRSIVVRVKGQTGAVSSEFTGEGGR